MITAMKPPIYSNHTQMVMTIFGLPINNSIQVFQYQLKITIIKFGSLLESALLPQNQLQTFIYENDFDRRLIPDGRPNEQLSFHL